MNRKELIKKYIEFFKSKNHKEIPNSSLIPENDPTVLFTTAGMHPLVPFLLGHPHPQGKRLVNVQRCIRTRDIEEVGDEVHHTFFEMLGNWSLGDYFKKQTIEYSFEFLTKVLKLSKEKLSVTCFKGENKISKDAESERIWKNLGISKIKFLGKKENWWGPAGKTGPCGPDSEIFYWISKKQVPKKFDPNDENWIELGNNVFMQYNQDEKKNLTSLKQKNVDFGGGSERMLALLEGHNDNYLTDAWQPLIKEIEKLTNKKYGQNKREFRIIADHIKAAIFIISDGISPSNKEQGYVLRRLIRRAIVYAKKFNLEKFTPKLAEQVFKIYDDYKFNKKQILDELQKEEEKFNLTLEKGLNLFQKIIKNKQQISGKESFLLFQSYGFPIEMTLELAKENKIKISQKGFQKELEKHQKLSRTATAGKFKSGLADNSEKTTRLHTASHLLLSAIQKVLKNKNIHQKGSNINSERLRLDFSFDRKLTEEEIQEIEKLINQQIQKAIPVTRQEMFLEQAKKLGACGVFDNKYGEKVSVYTIGDFSKEICTGPHVNNTKEIGKFKIQKQESCGAGIRRIKGVLLKN